MKLTHKMAIDFLRRIDVISSNAQIRIVSFDTHTESSSLKDSTRIARKKHSIPARHFKALLTLHALTGCDTTGKFDLVSTLLT